MCLPSTFTLWCFCHRDPQFISLIRKINKYTWNFLWTGEFGTIHCVSCLMLLSKQFFLCCLQKPSRCVMLRKRVSALGGCCTSANFRVVMISCRTLSVSVDPLRPLSHSNWPMCTGHQRQRWQQLDVWEVPSPWRIMVAQWPWAKWKTDVITKQWRNISLEFPFAHCQVKTWQFHSNGEEKNRTHSALTNQSSAGPSSPLQEILIFFPNISPKSGTMLRMSILWHPKTCPELCKFSQKSKKLVKRRAHNTRTLVFTLRVTKERNVDPHWLFHSIYSFVSIFINTACARSPSLQQRNWSSKVKHSFFSQQLSPTWNKTTHSETGKAGTTRASERELVFRCWGHKMWRRLRWIEPATLNQMIPSFDWGCSSADATMRQYHLSHWHSFPNAEEIQWKERGWEVINRMRRVLCVTAGDSAPTTLTKTRYTHSFGLLHSSLPSGKISQYRAFCLKKKKKKRRRKCNADVPCQCNPTRCSKRNCQQLKTWSQRLTFNLITPQIRCNNNKPIRRTT